MKIDVHANDREIPAGKVLLAEPGALSADEPRAIPFPIASAEHHEFPGRIIELVGIPAGWAPAGSIMRWFNGCYAVRFKIDGSRHSRRFRDHASARELFNKWTGRT